MNGEELAIITSPLGAPPLLPSAGIDQVAKRAVPLNVGPGSKTVAVGTLSVAAQGEWMPVRFDVDA
ncbi:hypothetical protein IscW_ISCW007763 [Ixodes scapularis]|uniref:Uncharacterized protein n=1 Tax=Ixodes scapularis TaxID=6945 RepID=B7PU52_IXOSC|nr:hypothetical protein IscW_ISCW007763 [Ixodes scapularis]|eukprot:XP_002405532.1 hypothetical protein IscW_ISCW007763 [Ixodes scapularis]